MGTPLVLAGAGGVDGAALTAAGVPTQSVSVNTAGTGGTATFYKVPTGNLKDAFFYRFTANVSNNSQMRTAMPATSKTFSFRGVYQASTTTAAAVIMGQRYASGFSWRLQQIASGALILQNSALGTLWTSPVLTVGTFYEISIDVVVGTSTSNGAIRMRICAQGTDTPITSGTFTSTTANLNTAVITHFDTGAVDQSSVGTRDIRWGFLQFENDRTVTSGFPASIPVYSYTPPVVIPDTPAPGAGYIKLDGTGGASGAALTATNVPTQSVSINTAGTGGTATYFAKTTGDLAGTNFYRFLANVSNNSQMRTAITNSKVQSFRGVYWAQATTASACILGMRYASGFAWRLQQNADGSLTLQGVQSAYVALWTSPVLTMGSLYEVVIDTVVGSGTTDGSIRVSILPYGSDTPISGGTFTTTTASLGTAVITHQDTGAYDQSAVGTRDVRWTHLQWENDRTLYNGFPMSLTRYSTTSTPPVVTIPTANFDIAIMYIQSNARGRADDFDTTLDVYREGVFHWNPTTNAVVRIDTEPAGTLGTFEQVPYMGPANRFSRAYVDGGKLATGRALLMVNLAEGGTGVTLPDSNGGNETWWPGETAAKTDLYARGNAEMSALFAAVGSGSKVVAILANHGSTDGTNDTPKATFKSRVTDVINGVRTFLYANSMTDVLNIPYIFMQMRPSLRSETRHAIIDDAQVELANELPNVRYSSAPVGTTYERPDSVHFNAEGVRYIGNAMYGVYADTDNTAPNAGLDQLNILPGTTVTLTATDFETVPTWTQLSGATVVLSGSGATRTFVAPKTRGESLVFQASDGQLTDTMVVSVLPWPYWALISNVEVPYTLVSA